MQIHRLDDPDTWWHLATGRLVWTTRAVPRVDPFSYTAAGAPWTNRQWLFEVALYASWLVGGAAAASLFAGALFVGALVLLWRLARRSLPPWATAILVALATGAAIERFTVRPEAVTCCCLAGVLLLLEPPVGWRTVAALVAVQVVWANCHALSALGLVAIAVTLAARAARKRDAGRVRRLGAACAGAALAEAATPFGIPGAVFPLRLLSVISGGEATSQTIVEHRTTTLAELSPVAGGALVILGVLGVAAAIAARRRLRLDHALVALAFGGLGLLARRNVALVGFGVAPFVASGLGPTLAHADAALGRRPWLRTALVGGLALGLVVVAARVVTGAFYDDAHLTRAFGLGESRLLYPARAVDFLEANAPDARVLNDDVLGGFLLWRAYPHRRVFFDGRLQMYPEAVYRDWQRVLDDPRQFPELAARWGITAAILHHPSPGRLELARGIARTPGWRVAYLDGGGIVLLADGRPATVPEGMTGPLEAFEATGLAAAFERLAARLRVPHEEASVHYQRGRAIHFLYGSPAFAWAREDFAAALALDPDDAIARAGMRAVGGAP